MSDQTAWDYLAAFITVAALAIGLISMAVGKISEWRAAREEEDDRGTPTRARPPLPRRVMSRVPPRIETPAHDLVSIPVSRYAGMAGGMENGAPAAPDIDEENAGMSAPTAARDIMSDEQFITLLARQKLTDGKYRLSANKIFEAVGGDRNTVLAQVKAVRSAPPSPAFRQSDGEIAPPSYPVTQRRPA